MTENKIINSPMEALTSSAIIKTSMPNTTWIRKLRSCANAWDNPESARPKLFSNCIFIIFSPQVPPSHVLSSHCHAHIQLNVIMRE